MKLKKKKKRSRKDDNFVFFRKSEFQSAVVELFFFFANKAKLFRSANYAKEIPAKSARLNFITTRIRKNSMNALSLIH